MSIVDVGANIGYYALLFVSHLRGIGKIVCLEPEPTNLIELRANVAENQLENLVEVLPVAAGNFDGMAKLEPGLNGLVVSRGSLEVPIWRIDSMNLGRVDLMKIDVEGFEGAVLDGATATIERDRPTLFLELHPQLLTYHTHSQLLMFLRRYYQRITAFQETRKGLVKKALANYGLAESVCQIDDLDSMITTYDARMASDTCWLVAQSN